MKKNILLISSLLFTISLVSCVKETITSTSNSTSTSLESTSSSTNSNYFEGEYIQTSFGQEYVTKVGVEIENGVIKKVTILEGSNVATDKDMWSSNNLWYDNEQKALDSYVGINVNTIKDANEIVVDNIAGATITSKRIFLAIKDALKS